MNNQKNQKLNDLGILLKKVIDGNKKLLEQINCNELKKSFALSAFINNIEKCLIKDSNNNINFNVEINKTILWDFIFLYKVIEKQLTDSEKNNIDIRDYKLYINNKEIISSELCFSELKKALVIAKRLRNCKSHENNSNIFISELNGIQMINFNNLHQMSQINCKIPFIYIEQFGQGIKAIKDDIDLVKDASNIANNIFLKLGFELKDFTNYIYNADTMRLKKLLKLVNNDINKLEKLPNEAFFCDEVRINYLWELADKNIDNFMKISFGFDVSSEKRINYLWDLVGKDINNFEKLPYGSFVCDEDDLNYLWNLVGKDINNFEKLPYGAFFCREERLNYLWSLVGKDINNFEKLPNDAFLCREERLNYLWNLVGKNIDEFGKLSYMPFYYEKKRIDYLLKFVNGDIEIFSKLPSGCFVCEKERYKYLWELSNKNMDNFTKIPSVAFVVSEKTLNYLLELVDKNINDFVKFPREAFYCINENINFFDCLWNLVDKNINDFVKIPKDILYYSVSINRVNYLWNLADKNIDRFSKLPLELFYCEDLVVDELFNMHKENVLHLIYNASNEKVIALIIYMHAIFSSYDENNIDFEKLDTTINETIGINDMTKKYKIYLTNCKQKIEYSGMSDIEIQEFYKNILEKKQKILELILNNKKDFVRKIRNCAFHFDIYEDPTDEESVILKHEYKGRVKFNKRLKIKEFFDFLEQFIQNQEGLDTDRSDIGLYNQIDVCKFSSSVLNNLKDIILTKEIIDKKLQDNSLIEETTDKVKIKTSRKI